MKYIYPTLFILVLSFGLVMSLMSFKNIDLNGDLKDIGLLSNNYFSEFDKQFNEKNVMREKAIGLISLINYVVFNQGKKELVIGQDNWLFSSEEFNQSKDGYGILFDNLESISMVNDVLEKKGIHLLLVPVPSKARVYKNKLLNKKPNVIHEDLFNQLLINSIKEDICIINTFETMQAMSFESFFKSDTHWTSNSTKKIAKEIVKQVKNKHPELLHKSNDHYELEYQRTVDVVGDLSVFLPVPDSISSQWVEQTDVYVTYNTSGSLDLFSNNQTVNEVALVGTSYSANEIFNFKQFLKYYFKNDILDYSLVGQGPFKPMVNFIQDLDQHQDIKIVLWEIPERYLIQAFDSESKYFETYINNETNLEKDYAYFIQ
ncbi:MAG: hypothetical protein HRU38_03430 [Saccharospirillaceae bacterium]|nr:hypothetical protein [Pseudomonadales bacterium]NRB77714.1 hypothetical protein [Saccharospirillaceae bacterium]